MPKFIAVFIISFFSLNFSLQDCTPGNGMKKGTILETQYTDKNGKIKDNRRLTVLDRTESSGTTEITMTITSLNKKSKDDIGGKMNLIIKDSKIFMNLNLQTDQQMIQMKDLKMSYDGDKIDYPCKSKVGDTFNDATSTMSFGTDSNPSLMKMTSKLMNRKVIGLEEFNINGKSYPCTIYTYDFESKMLFTISGSCKQWFNIDYGVLKTVNYDKKGNFEGTNEVININ